MKLQTTDAQVEHLQHAVNERRQGSSTVRVNAEALRNLLLDHHALAERVSQRAAA